MKKILSILICVSLVAASVVVFAACSNQKPENKESTTKEITTEEEIVGGWQRAESPVITDDFKKIFEKAVKKLTGVEYTPVAYVASQVVAGKNHCVLCKATPVTPNAASTYSLVYIYEDLDGNAEITDVVTSNASAQSTDNDGGWAATASPEMTKEATQALKKACETLTGAEYTPIALLATQIVAGTNYQILCESKPSIPSPESGYVIITVYADLDGNAEITETSEFDMANN